MIPFDFVYYRPDTLSEAVDIFTQTLRSGKVAVYFAGGSETISMCRSGSIQPDAVIDIKRIAALNEMTRTGQALRIGAAVTLSRICESDAYPLMKLACGRIADHTNQCRITLGGNLCGSIIYREASLPLLLADAHVTLYGPAGERTVPLKTVFDGRMLLQPGELIVRVHIPTWALSARFFHIKKTANEKIDYPLVSVAALCKDDQLRIGISGLCHFPFRCAAIEAALSDRTMSLERRVCRAMSLLPSPAVSAVQGSGEYRLFVLLNTLLTLLEVWENGSL